MRETFIAFAAMEVSPCLGGSAVKEEQMSVLKVGLLLTALTALLVVIGNAVGGTAGMAIALGLAAVLNISAFWFSDKMVLKMTGAQPIDPREGAHLYEMTERLAQRAGIPTPRLYIVNDPQPNAFATGRSPQHGVVAVNTGLLQMLSEREVEGVIAHEIAHIKHRDTLTMSIVATVAGAIMMLANMAQFAAIFGGHDEDRPNPIVLLVTALFAPMAAMMVQMAISRAREFEADATGARIAGTPVGLAGALQKLERGAQAIPSHMPAQAAHMCIVNPFAGIGGVANLFRSHPPTEQRVAKLMQLRDLAA